MNNMEEMKKSLKELPRGIKNCVSVCLDQIKREEKEHGEFKSIDDFIDRMLAANMDIHGFTVIGKYLFIRFPGGGDSTMLRSVLALRGFDPDYQEAPQVVTYIKYDAEDEELPFN